MGFINQLIIVGHHLGVHPSCHTMGIKVFFCNEKAQKPLQDLLTNGSVVKLLMIAVHLYEVLNGLTHSDVIGWNVPKFQAQLLHAFCLTCLPLGPSILIFPPNLIFRNHVLPANSNFFPLDTSTFIFFWQKLGGFLK